MTDDASFPVVRKTSFFKWDLPSRIDVAVDAQKADDENRRQVYAFVTKREESRCRVCDAFCNPHATTLLDKGHHHHIVYESAQGPTSVENVCLLCAKCHNAEHKHQIAIEGNANAAPWLTLSKKEKSTGHWYVWRQEVGIRLYERD
jgi:5-methylcytosine-specific restriction endonuclease McrA